jgi:surface antigen
MQSLSPESQLLNDENLSFVDSSIASSLDDEDKRLIAVSSQNALEYLSSGQTIEWKNPNSRYHGYVFTGAPYKDNNLLCRSYQQKISSYNGSKIFQGRACRGANNTWKKVQ